ncbi:NAD(P)H quinone oxidoreductase [Paractinoplanes deccanensis]|uniref:NAD(P)H quinone oxidoreductase n=1 Tax=Paractinoplanes deccanensis TaxID=113561 RepID=A0ABQ3XY81_9ACTN|nr:NAD(P)H-quinone oxidoreductase [Actinoplanes deccanensis]GID72685.1 NAD(P)H quinone oxidoreductase [Actinoplanes deccanensis]
MFAICIREPGGPEVLAWTAVPDPRVRAGEVLIDITAGGVNRGDLLQRTGHYDPPPGSPPYPGLECSGRIAAVGAGVRGWRPGDEVCALLAGGGYAEKVAVPAGQVLPVPKGVGLAEAAALPEVACTVWVNLVRHARLRAGETLLVHGGGSGIGTFALQFAAALGARVLTTARPVKHEALRGLGAEVTIDYTTEDFAAAVLRATGGRGADVILDILGGGCLDRNVRALAVGGRLVVIGLQRGRRGELDLSELLARRATVTATALRGRPAAEKAAIVRGTRDDVWPLVESGAIRPVVDRVLPMTEAARAHQVLAAGEHIGKVLLLTGPGRG